VSGASEYKLNRKIVTYSTYNHALVQHSILVKAKNFLVFQGDVEAVASQSPKDLTRLIEQISGSLELASEYDKAKDAQDRATENATFNFTRRRGINGEIRQYKEQKSEADRYEALCQEKVRICCLGLTQNQGLISSQDELLLRRVLYRLYHIEESLAAHADEIKRQNRTLAGLRQEQQTKQDELDAARAEQAKCKTKLSKKEKALKKAEKALEAQVGATQIIRDVTDWFEL
jgi:structural maintenance of chromosome 1